MRVLHVYRTYFPDSRGGIQEAIKQIALSTKSQGIDSKIYCLSKNPNPINIRLKEGVISRGKSWIAPMSCNIGGINSFVEFQKLVNWADIIHYHFPWPFIDLLHLFNFSKKPTVVTYHSDIVKQKILKVLYAPLMHHTLNNVSMIVGTSPNYINTSPILKKYLLKGKVKMIPLGLEDVQYDLSIAAQHDYLKQNGVVDKYILFIGVLRYYKGLQFLLEASRSIKGQIVIAGAGPEESKLKALYKKYQCSNVIFLGEVSEIQKYILLKHCNAFVFPSHLRSEAFGMALLEASAQKKPLITCEIGSGSSYVNIHELTGIVVPPNNSFALSEACNTLLSNKILASKMGKEAFKRYKNLFSAKAIGNAYSLLYDRLITDQKKICFVVTAEFAVRAFLLDHLRALSNDYELTLFVNTENPNFLNNLGIKIRVVYIPIQRSINIIQDIRTLWLLIKFFKSERFDAIQTITPKAGLLGMLAGRQAGIQNRIHTFTGQVWANKKGVFKNFLKILDFIVAKIATQLIIDSTSQRDFLVDQKIITPKKANVFGSGSVSGVNLNRFKKNVHLKKSLRAQLGLPNKAFVFLFLGRMNKDKGVFDLINAFQLLSNQDSYLLLVGPDEENIEGHIECRFDDYKNRIRLIKMTHQPENYIAAADVICLPSYREGFGSSIIEAAAMGLPAIASRIYGLVDAVKDKSTGLLHKPGDINEIKNYMDLMISDKTLYKKLSLRAASRAKRQFNSVNLVNYWQNFYKQILG